MAQIRIDELKAQRYAAKVSTGVLKTIVRDTVALAKKWPRAGNPSWTDSNGNLARHIRGDVTPGLNPKARVWCDVDYALAIHEGTPHRIIYRKLDKRMKFSWKRKGGEVVYRNWVNHPATKGNHFLSRPLAIVSAKHGFKTTGTLLP